MGQVPNRWTDERMDNIISVLLRSGVILSASIVLIGGAMYLVQYRHLAPDYRVFRGEPTTLRHLGTILHGVVTFHSRSWMQLGLFLLVATPVARVAFSIFGFFKERDRTYVLLTLVVLCVLLFSFLEH
ncbi:MAG TPA: DUF1634 domain-containing protein [Candidatus Acidoferrales bacterium]|nr:DUF1634 domain-containing protein [Candidatus Acidoferrales bacterium]